MTPYLDALTEAMTLLARAPRSIIVGQGVSCAGTAMTDTFRHVRPDQLLEFPVAEDFQMGFCIGLSLEGWLPICVFPRWNFALCAANQMVNHLDRLPIYSGYRPKVIIRTCAPSRKPFDPGPQHDDDFSWAFRSMFRTIKLVRLMSTDRVVPEYREALARPISTVLVEQGDLYGAQAPSGVREKLTEAAG